MERKKVSLKPIVKWINLYQTPSKTIVINYHTIEMLRTMKSIGDHGSILGKRDSSEAEVVDLTLVESPSDDQKRNVSDDRACGHLDQDSIKFVPVVKTVPLLDITGDDEVLSSVDVQSSSSAVFN